MEIEIISKEKIKPNAPTPHHLRIYNLSLLDQIIPPIYIPAVLYFASAGRSSLPSRIQLLRNSLSSTLTVFYPLAGVIKDALSLDCNDQGLPFLVAKVKGNLGDFLQNPNMQFLNSFLPTQLGKPGPGANAATVQLNCFDCGGIALALTFAHNLADLTSICTFLRAWAANAASNSTLSVPLNCIAQSTFPQNVAIGEESSLYRCLYRFVRRGKFVTKRYVFKWSSLKTMISCDQQPPSRVELVTALISEVFMEAAAGLDRKPFLLTHSVNLRKRARPPFPENSFGNFLWLAPAPCPDNGDLMCLVNEMKGAMRRIDAELVRKLQSDKGYYESLEKLNEGIPQDDANWFAVTSWSKVGLYDVDFGWGKPIWLSGFVSGDSETVMCNGATLIDTRIQDGIEAWVIVEDRYATRFENNDKIHKYAQINPPAF